MHIKLINKKLLFDKHKIKCAIGKNGLSSNKKEGDHTTPKGKFKFLDLYYRKDRVLKIKTKLKKLVIKKYMGWCDDPKSKDYNKIIRIPLFKHRYEKLHREDHIYDVIIVINYNTRPIKKNKGSAIFLHIATKNFKVTEGCLAVTKKDMRILLKYINKNTELIIY